MRALVVRAMAVVLLGVSSCYAQFNQPNPCRVLIEVTYEDGREKVEFAEVELSDAMGTSSAMDRKDTNRDGRAEFQSYTGKHRVRIRGSNIGTYDGDFEIMPGESYHVERIRVKRVAGTGSGDSPAAGITNAARFSIPDEARKEYEKGREFLAKQKWEEARERFQAVVEIAPQFDLGHYYQGVAALQMKDTAAARASFEKAVTLNDKFAEAQRTYARMLLPEKEFTKIAELLTKSLAVEPQNAWALMNLAFAELQLQRFADAQAHAQRVHSVQHEGMANAHMIAGYALDAQGKKAEAISEFKLYLKEDPKGPNVKRAQEFIAKLESK
jgi:Tfp pilus assembly protein PilF